MSWQSGGCQPAAIGITLVASPKYPGMLALLLLCGLGNAIAGTQTAKPLPIGRRGFNLQHIFYINRDARKDRRTLMERSLADSGIPYSRFPAVELTIEDVAQIRNASDRSSPWSRFIDAATQRESQHFASTSVHVRSFILGCLLSHMSLLQRVAASPAGPLPDQRLYMILEDDVLLTHDWRSALAKTVALLPAEWHMLRCNVRYVDKVKRINQELYRANGDIKKFHGTHCIVTTPSRASHILDQLKLIEINDYDAMCTTDRFVSVATPNFRTKLGVKVVIPLQHNNASRTDHKHFKAKSRNRLNL